MSDADQAPGRRESSLSSGRASNNAALSPKRKRTQPNIDASDRIDTRRGFNQIWFLTRLIQQPMVFLDERSRHELSVLTRKDNAR